MIDKEEKRLLLRVATDDSVLPENEELAPILREVDQNDDLFPTTLWPVLRRTFTPRGVSFFDFYIKLKRINLGIPVGDEDLRQLYNSAINRLIQATSPVDGKTISFEVVNMLVESRSDLSSLMMRLMAGRTEDTSTWRRINDTYVPLIQAVCKDKGIYLAFRQLGAERWGLFRRMSAQQEKNERLKDSDPESYALTRKFKETLDQIDQKIQRRIRRMGLEPKKIFLAGKPVNIGVNPAGEELVFDLDGDVLDKDSFIEKRRLKADADQRLYRMGTRTTMPKDIRGISDERIAELTGDIEFVSITDDKAKSGRLTRIYPTKWMPIYIGGSDGVRVESTRVIIAGRFKGLYLDDMVNATGRMVEGSAFSYNRITGRSGKVPPRSDPSQREPYVTVTETVETARGEGGRMVKTKKEKLFVKIPGTRQFTEARKALKALACNAPAQARKGCIPSLVYQSVEGSNAAAFTFEAKDFAAVLDAVQGMSLSQAAQSFLQEYFQELSRADQATADKNLAMYSADALGGFKTARKDPATGEMKQVDLLTLQKKALAWLDANGNHGVCALDTGIGKCVRGDTLVSTAKGLLHIKNMVPPGLPPDSSCPAEGEVLIGGEALPLKNFYYGGLKPTLRVQSRNGYEIEGSYVHPLLTRTEGGLEGFQPLPGLRVGDYLCVSRTPYSFSPDEPSLPVPTKEDFGKHASRLRVFPVPSQMNPDLARLLGYIVAEGWTNYPNQFTITQCPNLNPETRQDIEKLLRGQFGWEPSEDKDILITSRFLRLFLERLGVDYTRSAGKIIPPIILQSTKESVIGFVRAFVDAEGSVSQNGIEVTSASEQLIRELQVLLLHLGIISVRASKMAKGYDHVYWRLTIQGDHARKYASAVGMVSVRKQAALSALVQKTANSNHDVIPYAKEMVEALRTEIFALSGGQNRGGGLYARFGPKFTGTLTHIRQGRRNPTYAFLEKMLDVARQVGASGTVAYATVKRVCEQHYFYDPVKKVNPGFCEVFDIEVDDPRHWFLGNGLVNHNTLTSIGMMQKLTRDGLTETDAIYRTPEGKNVQTNGRYLFVCPPKLKGNFAKEVRNFISDPRSLLDRVDVISFREFGLSYRNRKVPKSITGVSFWKNRDWDPALYVAIFFDEAHILTNQTSAAAQAALKLYHPRKICLTASPMEDNPMQAYVLAAVANNTPLFGQSQEAYDNRLEMRRFKDRFCETVGGHIVGVKQDVLLKRDLQTWVKRNVFYADKTQVVEPHASVPSLQASTLAVEMAPPVEEAYRVVTDHFAEILGGLVARYQFKGKSPAGKPSGRDPAIDRFFTLTFAPVLQLMNSLSNYPAEAMFDISHMLQTGTMPYPGRGGQPRPIPKSIQPLIDALGARFTPERLREMGTLSGNPKLESAAEYIRRKLDWSGESARTLIFSDDKRLCAMAARHMAQQIEGWHVLALPDSIHILEGGSEVTSIKFELTPEMVRKAISNPEEQQQVLDEFGGWSTIPLPIKQHVYRKYPMLPAKDPDNSHYRADQWPQFAFREIITPNPQIKTCTLFGPAYSHGQNLQAFDTVVHLDRDTWDSETMKQRTARAWRQGQTNPVDEVTIDTTYSATEDGVPRDEFDKTLDEIRALVQGVDAEIFDQIIKESQEIALGKEWINISQRGASHFHMNRKIMELMTSPFVGRSETPGAM